jgi:uncharacterized membrane protein YfcA
MHFPIADVTLSPLFLIGLGFVIGILGGFFGVGGSFLAGPALFAAGMPMNFVVGTDLTHLVGKSIVAARRHHLLGNIDLRLAGIMVIGTLIGSEGGVQAIEALKRHSQVDLVVGSVSIALFLCIAAFMAVESIKMLRKGGPAATRTHDRLAFNGLAKWVQRLNLPPHIDLTHSGIRGISVWAILAVGLVGGFFSGFLGGGAGYIRMPAMVYVLGIPTHIAVGTDLFEIVISAGYGAFRHATHGNVDILIALVMQTGAAVGARIGASLTQYVVGPKIRLAFAPLPLLGAALVAYKLLAGSHA